MSPPRGRAKSNVEEPRPPPLPPALARHAEPAGDLKAGAAHRFDKVFPVFLTSARGIANGVGRNISPEGMFIETRDVCPIGSEVRVTFEAPAVGAHLTAVATVRFQALLNYTKDGGAPGGLRGIGVRFLRFEDDGRPATSLRQ